jgi:AcrR family transcriptional regulator
MLIHDRIVRKSTELFFNYGINSISTDNISVELGISKRTFYQHFESKQQLIELIATDEIALAKINFKKLKMCGYNAVVEAIKICELDVKYKNIRSIHFLRDIKRSYPDVWKLYENFKVEYIETVLIENIGRGISEKYYWPDLNKTVTANLWIEWGYLHHGLEGSYEDIRRHFLRGLLTQRGISEYLFWQ